ncbi:MAG: hypothetical protein A2020_06045 [Lentisphaerae bacterium GWF2_45_14]|nr:MAG: hypothetical protein A2020_06045 [Lentisphaerae bacterium GWF2_45_14]
MNMKDRVNTKWFTDAKFGMFIHWGLYAIPGGTWKGIDTPWVSEWIMRKLKIPIRKYESLAKKFNPVKFDAAKWVKTAKDAGMKYMVITSKHHDGFAMFHSKYDKYNIVDATPFKRDPLKELSVECRNAGIKLGFYYSQDQDWHEAGGSGNDWDFKNKTEKAFSKYLETKVKSQLRELLTNYGEVSIIWFDTPYTIRKEQSQDLKDYVHSLQPDCLVSGRVGHNLGDYGSLGDNQIPSHALQGAWEGLGTMNESWGYKATDKEMKSVNKLLETMFELISRNANYLLNVGPTAEGLIPEESVKSLRRIGKWLSVNGDAVYEAEPNPIMMHHQPQWGYITGKNNSLNLVIFRQPANEIILYGIRNKIEKIHLLSNEKILLKFHQEHRKNYDYHKLVIELPGKKLGKLPCVLKVSISGKPDINEKSYRADTF